MSNITVYQIKLIAWANSNEITVSLYSGETLAGQCQSHTGGPVGWAGYSDAETLGCDRVTADKVRLAYNSTSWQWLYMDRITVTGASTSTIGI